MATAADLTCLSLCVMMLYLFKGTGMSLSELFYIICYMAGQLYDVSGLPCNEKANHGTVVEVAGFPYINREEHESWTYRDAESLAGRVSKVLPDYERIHITGVITAGASGSIVYKLGGRLLFGREPIVPYGLLSDLILVKHAKAVLDSGIRVIWPWPRVEALAQCGDTHYLRVVALV